MQTCLFRDLAMCATKNELQLFYRRNLDADQWGSFLNLWTQLPSKISYEFLEFPNTLNIDMIYFVSNSFAIKQWMWREKHKVLNSNHFFSCIFDIWSIYGIFCKKWPISSSLSEQNDVKTTLITPVVSKNVIQLPEHVMRYFLITMKEFYLVFHP